MKVLYPRAFLCPKYTFYKAKKAIPKRSHLTGIFLYTAIAILSMCPAVAQTSGTKPSPFAAATDFALKEGDTLPSKFFEYHHKTVDFQTSDIKEGSIDKHKGKLIILDFWADWCAPCLSSMLSLDSIQGALGNNDFVVVPVTYQDENRIRKKLESVVKIPGQSMRFGDYYRNVSPTIVADTLLHKLFPHTSIPYQVWIKDNLVYSIPRPHFATYDIISKVLEGARPTIRSHEKHTLPDSPYFVDGNGGAWQGNGTRSVMERGNAEFGQQKLIYTKSAAYSLLQCYNVQPFRDLYFGAFRPEIHPLLGIENGIVVELPKVLRDSIFSEAPKMGEYSSAHAYQEVYDRWVGENWYSYSQFFAPAIPEDLARQYMTEDVNRFFRGNYGIQGQMEKRARRFAVLRGTKSLEEVCALLATKGGKKKIDNAVKGDKLYVTNAPFRAIYHQIGLAFGKIPLLDATDITGDMRVDFTMDKKALHDKRLLTRELAKYGLIVAVEEHIVPVLVIKEVQTNGKSI